MLCAKFGEDCSKYVGGVVKKQIRTEFKMADMDADRFVWTQRIQEKRVLSLRLMVQKLQTKRFVIVPPSGQIAPNSGSLLFS